MMPPHGNRHYSYQSQTQQNIFYGKRLQSNMRYGKALSFLYDK